MKCLIGFIKTLFGKKPKKENPFKNFKFPIIKK